MDINRYVKNGIINTLIVTVPVWILSYIFPNDFWVVLATVVYALLIAIFGRYIKSEKVKSILLFQDNFALKDKKYRYKFAIIVGILAMIIGGINEWFTLPKNAYISMILPLILITQIISGVIYYHKYKNKQI